MATNALGLSPDELVGHPVGQGGIYTYQTGGAGRRNSTISSMVKNNTENPIVWLTLKKVSIKAENSACSHPTDLGLTDLPERQGRGHGRVGWTVL